MSPDELSLASEYLSVCKRTKNKEKQKQLLKNMPVCAVKEICNYCHNLYKNKLFLPVAEQYGKGLRRYGGKVKLLSSRRTSWKRKREILQSGGVFPFLIPIIAALSGLGVKAATVAAIAAPIAAKAALAGGATAAGAYGVQKIIEKAEQR